MEKKVYLGDAVYAAWDGYHIVLTTDTFGVESNKIYLDPTVLNALTIYSKQIYSGVKYEDCISGND